MNKIGKETLLHWLEGYRNHEETYILNDVNFKRKKYNYMCDCEYLGDFKPVNVDKEGLCEKCGYYATAIAPEELEVRGKAAYSEDKIINRYKDIIKYRKEGLRVNEIANRLGVSKYTIDEILYFKKSYKKHKSLIDRVLPEYNELKNKK